MKNILALVLLVCSFFGFSQNQVLKLIKTSDSEFKLDGILSESELKNAFPI